MNSPFTREEQGVARSLERIARNMERLIEVLERVETKLDKLNEKVNTMTKDSKEAIAYVRDGIDMEDPEREVRIRAVVLLPGDNKVDLVDFECEPDDIETELIEHYGHSQFLYMAGPTCDWHMRHKYIDGLGESEVIEEKML